MRKVALFTLAAALAMLAAGCQEPPTPATVTPSVHRTDRDGRLRAEVLARSADQIVEAMGTRADREARAPYSPKWWTLEVGDTITYQRSWELLHLEPWNGLGSVFWLDTLVFTPVYRTVWPEGSAVPIGEAYEGHFPRKSTDPPDWWRHEVPEHLSGESDADITRWLHDPDQLRGVRSAGDLERAMWTRARWLEGWTGPESGGGNE